MEEKSKKIVGEIKVSDNLFLDLKGKVISVSLLNDFLNEISLDDTSQLLEAILGGGVVLNASDIHIEPGEEEVRIRARIDGLLQDIFVIDLNVYKSILSRIKLLSGIKLNINQKSQDGRFSVSFPEINDKKETQQAIMEIRASTLPSEYGETVVLRLLNPKALVEMELLGLRDDARDLLEREIKKPHGMIVVTGPTGSGKTTTLYAILKKIRKPEVKVVTIEDPVEYHLDNISQTEVNSDKGYDFANGLRAIVRQDPDVILVGEIRDLETAQIALQAALTGHLVLTTLHTNDASSAIARLQALGEKPHNIAPAINIIIAQRLVRKVCSCSQKESIPQDRYQKIQESLKDVKNIDLSQKKEIYKAKGCDECNDSGYKGRLGLFEVLVVDDEMESLILSAPPSSEIRKSAIKKGMITMYQDGLIKVLEGKTTLEEIDRVVFE